LIPNGQKFSCLTCHVRTAGGEDRNSFGQAVLAIVGGRQCFEFWGPGLAATDSDGDGRTNGQELGDPRGVWKRGDPSPGDPALVTPPGVNEETLPKLELIAVEPAQVSTRGGTPVKVHGANFMVSTVIKIGASPLAEQVLVDAALIDGVVPAMDPTGTPGPMDVTAEDERGIAVLVRGVSYVTPQAVEKRLLRGDVNADGTVQVSDAIHLLLFLFHGGAILSSLEAADANEDARVDASDAVFILAQLFLEGPPVRSALPPPGSDLAPTRTKPSGNARG